MKIDIKGIIEGTWNSIFVKQAVEEIAKERLAICSSCPMNSDAAKVNSNYKSFRPDYHCTQCGCDLHLKSRSLSNSCPLGKWSAVASEEQDHIIYKKLEETDNVQDSNNQKHKDKDLA